MHTRVINPELESPTTAAREMDFPSMMSPDRPTDTVVHSVLRSPCNNGLSACKNSITFLPDSVSREHHQSTHWRWLPIDRHSGLSDLPGGVVRPHELLQNVRSTLEYVSAVYTTTTSRTHQQPSMSGTRDDSPSRSRWIPRSNFSHVPCRVEDFSPMNARMLIHALRERT